MLLGVAVAAMVVTGALLVGDSLRGSLREQALRRLGGIELAMLGGRFFRQAAAEGMNGVAAAIILPATIERGGGADSPRRIPGATIWGIGADFHFAGVPSAGVPPSEAWLAQSAARVLGVSAGDSIEIVVPRSTDVPRESLLGRRGASETTQRLVVPVGRIIAPDDVLNDLALRPAIEPAVNVFVNRNWLQDQLDEPGRVNTILARGGSAVDLQAQFGARLTLDDWGLIVRTPRSRTEALLRALDRNRDGRIQPNEYRGRLAESVIAAIAEDADRALTASRIESHYRGRGYDSLESRQMLLPPAVESAAIEAARAVGLRPAPTLIYLANSISDGTAAIPYSIIAALDPASLPAPDGPPPWSLGDDGILLADWSDSPLHARPGDAITVTFFESEMEGQVRERTARFTLRGFVPMRGLAADPDLAPEFPGITDKLDLKEWDPPFPYDNKRIQRRDDDFWARYRTTPKAYISLDAGRALFGSRFGQATSIRLSTSDGTTPTDDLVQRFESELLARLDPAAGGFVFEDVHARAVAASAGGQDFGLLFLGFSFFLIAAALVLIIVLVRLSVERRADEVGLLLAVGFRRRDVRRLLVGELLVVAGIGSLIGVGLAIVYAEAMVRLLAALWPDPTARSILSVHVGWSSLAIGLAGTVMASWLAFRWALRTLARVSPSALVAGQFTEPVELAANPSRRPMMVAGAAALGAIALVVAGRWAHGVEQRAGAFFGAGALMLCALLAAGWAWLRRPDRRTIHPGPGAVARLGFRSVVRNPSRSLLTAALLSSAAFLLVAVEAFRRNPEADFAERTGGSGGFPLLAESQQPIYLDPGGSDGRQELLDALEKSWRRQSPNEPRAVDERLRAARATLETMTIIPLRRQAGDDASCLNLYQPGRPRIIGVPPALIRRGGFQFAESEGAKDNPWQLLESPGADGAIPAIGEAHTVQWMLKSGLGGTVMIRDGAGRDVPLRIVALLRDSVFQGELLIADAAFRRLFPRSEGYTMFLIDPAGRPTDAREWLSLAYAEKGLVVRDARDRLQAYLQVENTYLSTFQILGGFGLLLGTLGLAVVLLRNAWERRREFALMRAVGYRSGQLAGIVVAENVSLVLLGLGAGVLAAAFAVVPAGDVAVAGAPWSRLIVLLSGAALCGIAAGSAAVRSTLRAPLIPALRRE